MDVKTTRQAGLTMVEILVTLSITAVLASVSLPPLTNLIESSQADSEAADFFTSLLLARSDSATRNNMVTLCKINPTVPTSCDNTENWQSGWISFEDTDADGVKDAGEEVINTFTGMRGNASVTTVNYTNVISFLPSGGITTNGSINLCVNGNFANTIFINATGRPRVASSTCP
jgi:type IV fimbrial biogenesis protein FimT